MTRPLAAAAFAVVLILLPAAAATAEQAAPALLRVGDTGIRCKRAPCPWRGVVPAEHDAAGAADPAYVGEAPPVIAARPELLDRAQAEIRRAWATGGCLMVLGRFERRGAAATPILSVERIEGPCDD
jgi:hypothetical protein